MEEIESLLNLPNSLTDLNEEIFGGSFFDKTEKKSSSSSSSSSSIESEYLVDNSLCSSSSHNISNINSSSSGRMKYALNFWDWEFKYSNVNHYYKIFKCYCNMFDSIDKLYFYILYR